MVSFEFVEIPENEFVVLVRFLVVLGYNIELFDTFFVVSLQFGQVVLKVVQLAFEFSALFFPADFLFHFALLHVIELLLEVFVRVGLVA